MLERLFYSLKLKEFEVSFVHPKNGCHLSYSKETVIMQGIEPKEIRSRMMNGMGWRLNQVPRCPHCGVQYSADVDFDSETGRSAFRVKHERNLGLLAIIQGGGR